MATLAELHELYRDATATHPDPTAVPDPNPEITEANDFYHRVESHLWRRAAFYLDDPANDVTSDKRFTRWADATVTNPRGMAQRALILALGSTNAESLSRAQILGLTDTQIGDGLNGVIPQMAYAVVLK